MPRGGGTRERAPEAQASRVVCDGKRPRIILKSTELKIVFSAFSTRYFVSKLIVIKCKMTDIFRTYNNISEVSLI